MTDDDTQPAALTWSPDCAEIFAALAVAQANMAALTKGKSADVTKKGDPTVVLYSYSYTDLPSSLAACLGAYNEAGCAVIQAPRVFPNGPEITTLITHKSGQWLMAAGCFVPAAAKGAQDVGSAITYARRYALQAIAGLSPSDDDGKAANDSPPDSWNRDRSPRSRPADLGPRCTGPCQALADSNNRRASDLAAADSDPDISASNVLWWAVGQLPGTLTHGKYGLVDTWRGELLTVVDGNKVRTILKARATELGLEPEPPASDEAGA